MKVWEVFFDHREEGHTKGHRIDPLILDLNMDGKFDITGANQEGNGKIDGETVAFDIDLHYLWVPRPRDETTPLQTWFNFLMPFSNRLWLTLIGTTLAMALLQVWIFRDEWRKDGFDEWTESKGWWQKTKAILDLWGRYLGRSFMHLTAGFPDEGRTAPQTLAWRGAWRCPPRLPLCV